MAEFWNPTRSRSYWGHDPQAGQAASPPLPPRLLADCHARTPRRAANTMIPASVSWMPPRNTAKKIAEPVLNGVANAGPQTQTGIRAGNEPWTTPPTEAGMWPGSRKPSVKVLQPYWPQEVRVPVAMNLPWPPAPAKYATALTVTGRKNTPKTIRNRRPSTQRR